MSDLELFLSTSMHVWHNSISLINKYGKADLNMLYKDGKIEIRNGVNVKIIKYKKL